MKIQCKSCGVDVSNDPNSEFVEDVYMCLQCATDHKVKALEKQVEELKQFAKNVKFAHDTNIFELTTGLLYEYDALQLAKEK